MRHVYVFDLDDTLYLERDYVRSGFLAVGRHVEATCARTGFADAAWSLFERGVRGRTFDDALAVVDIPRSDALLGDLVRVYREHAPEIALAPDAARMLARCRTIDAPTAIISDGWLVAQERKVAALGLRTAVDVVVLSDALGRDAWKPSERPYRAVEGAFDGRADAFTYFGDNPRKDFVTARRLGWKTVRVRRAHGEHRDVVADTEHEADVTVASFDEFALDTHRIERR